MRPRILHPGTHFEDTRYPSFWKQRHFSSNHGKQKTGLYWSLKYSFHASIFAFVQDNQKWKVDTKSEMANRSFVDEETIPLVQDKDYDDCNTPDTSRVDKTSFTEFDTTEASSILQLRKKVKRDKITTL